MSLATARAAFKTAMVNLADRVDDKQSQSEAIDEYLDALETYIKAAQLNNEIPIGAVIVAATGGVLNAAPITLVKDNGLT